MSIIKITTPVSTIAFPNLFEARANDNGGKPKYGCALYIPKSDPAFEAKHGCTFKEAFDRAAKQARDEFCAKHGNNALPVNFQTTLHDGDGFRPSGDPYGPECKGCWVINVSTLYKPLVVGLDKQEITDPAAVYGGCKVRACINPYGYSYTGKKGVSAGLLSVQKVAEGQTQGARGSANDFDDMPGATGSASDFDDDLLG